MSEREPLSEKQERKKSVGYDATVIEKVGTPAITTHLCRYCTIPTCITTTLPLVIAAGLAERGYI